LERDERDGEINNRKGKDKRRREKWLVFRLRRGIERMRDWKNFRKKKNIKVVKGGRE
jgi:hypothetical protein